MGRWLDGGGEGSDFPGTSMIIKRRKQSSSRATRRSEYSVAANLPTMLEGVYKKKEQGVGGKVGKEKLTTERQRQIAEA